MHHPPRANLMPQPQEYAEFSAKVPRHLYEEFKKLMPAYGGTQWFINSALAEFLKQLRAEPELLKQVHSSVDAMLQLNRVTREEVGAP